MSIYNINSAKKAAQKISSQNKALAIVGLLHPMNLDPMLLDCAESAAENIFAKCVKAQASALKWLRVAHNGAAMAEYNKARHITRAWAIYAEMVAFEKSFNKSLKTLASVKECA